MTTAATPSLGHDRPPQLIEEAHERAFAVLADSNAPDLDAVVWLCVHLAAVQQVVHPELARVFDTHVVTAFRRGAGRLERTLRAVDQLQCGDALVSNVDATRVLRTLVGEVRAQADLEHRLLDELAERLSTDEQRRLVADHEHALTQAPTRPHPHAPHGRVFGRLAYLVKRTLGPGHGHAGLTARPHAAPRPRTREGNSLGRLLARRQQQRCTLRQSMTRDSFAAHSRLKVGDTDYGISRLDRIDESARLPYSLKVALENLLRNEDGRLVTADQVQRLADWDPDAAHGGEIQFTPARVLLQDFTGVPCVVDFVAMRDAMTALGGDPAQDQPVDPGGAGDRRRLRPAGGVSYQRRSGVRAQQGAPPGEGR